MDGKEAGERRRRRLPRRAWLHVTGLFAVVLLCFGFVSWAVWSKPAEASVLAVAAPLAVGQVIAEGDVVEVAVAADEVGALGLIPVHRSGEVVGKVAAVPLQAGTLLHRRMVGAPVIPQNGFVKVTLALADGRWPADVQAGQQVALLGASDAEATGIWQTAGTVLDLERPEAGGALVTVEMPQNAIAGLVAVDSASLLMASTAANGARAATVPDAGGGD